MAEDSSDSEDEDAGGAEGPEWWFYHLSRSPVTEAAPPILAKCLERGWRVLVCVPSADARAELDRALWTQDPASFLPHGQKEAEGLDPARQPLLLSADPDPVNGAQALMLTGGAETEDTARYERVMVVFGDGEASARDTARRQFKAARDAGLAARYFQQTSRGWKEAG